MVKLVTYGDTRFLFTGDIGISPESTILSEGMSVEAGILKVAPPWQQVQLQQQLPGGGRR